MLGDPSAPVLDRDSEVQELVVTHSGEANDGTTVEHHEAVDPRRGEPSSLVEQPTQRVRSQSQCRNQQGTRPTLM